MLVLSRKLDEQIIIGEGANRIVITVIHIERNKIRLGIDADRSIPIHRSELLDPPPSKPAA